MFIRIFLEVKKNRRNNFINKQINESPDIANQLPNYPTLKLMRVNTDIYLQSFASTFSNNADSF